MAIKYSGNFLLRKLHQLTGIVPLGLFFLVHIYTNSTSLSGPKVFNEHVQDIHDIPYLLLIEIFGIFIPLLFHSIYGVIIATESHPNTLRYGYGRNWFYLFQRITGIFLFFFIFFHVLNLRFGLIPGLESYGMPVAGHAGRAYSIVNGEFQNISVLILYFLGVVATAWHLAYGFWLFAVDWGLIIGEKAQAITLKASVALAVVLSAVGINAAMGFVRPCGLLPSVLCEQAPKEEISTPGHPTKF